MLPGSNACDGRHAFAPTSDAFQEVLVPASFLALWLSPAMLSISTDSPASLPPASPTAAHRSWRATSISGQLLCERRAARRERKAFLCLVRDPQTARRVLDLPLSGQRGLPAPLRTARGLAKDLSSSQAADRRSGPLILYIMLYTRSQPRLAHPVPAHRTRRDEQRRQRFPGLSRVIPRGSRPGGPAPGCDGGGMLSWVAGLLTQVLRCGRAGRALPRPAACAPAARRSPPPRPPAARSPPPAAAPAPAGKGSGGAEHISSCTKHTRHAAPHPCANKPRHAAGQGRRPNR